jgi:exopolysaccharide production protein ExoZ
MGQQGESDVLLSLQYLRAIAAGLVVLHHAGQVVETAGNATPWLKFGFGASGVDIFFVISGYIMCRITAGGRDTAWQFFRRRLARVGPAYWIITALVSLAIIFVPSAFRSSVLTPDLLAASLAFIAWPHPVRGEAWPVFHIGWTLNYEFFFYSIFAVALACARRHRIAASSAVLLLLVVAGQMLPLNGAVWNFYTHPIILEFALGMALWEVDRRQMLPRKALAWLLILAASAVLIYTEIAVPMSRSSPERAWLWGVPGFFIALGALALERQGAVRNHRLWHLLGDASYSWYLTHFLVLGVLRGIWSKFALRTALPDPTLILIGLIVTAIASILFYKLVELPASRWFRRLILPK